MRSPECLKWVKRYMCHSATLRAKTGMIRKLI
jgi:hypothetical protein